MPLFNLLGDSSTSYAPLLCLHVSTPFYMIVYLHHNMLILLCSLCVCVCVCVCARAQVFVSVSFVFFEYTVACIISKARNPKGKVCLI